MSDLAKGRNPGCRRLAGLLLALTATAAGKAWANWDGEPSLDDIDFNQESFIDINAYQFRRSEEIAWYGVENGLRVSAGSLETNRLYLLTDLRLKQEVTPNLVFRLSLAEEEFYEPREFPRPLLELELRPSSWPLSLSLIGAPAYAKREADLGVAATLGQRPWNFVRLSWLNADHYFNDKNEQDDSFYRREPRQLTLEAAFQWADRYKLRLLIQDNQPLEFIQDDQNSLFAYENRNYRASFDYQADNGQNFGIILRGFDTQQRHEDGDTPRSQDLRYFSIDGYWFRYLNGQDEWTLGIRYDDFRNDERTPADPGSSFDLMFTTLQAYTSYYHPFRANQAWELGLHLGQAVKEEEFLFETVESTREERFEAKLSTGWELFATDRSSALTLAISWNLDEITADPFDGGSVRFQTRF